LHFGRQLRHATPAVIAYLLFRLLGFAVLAAMAPHYGERAIESLAKWDGRWFIGIAANGYDTSLAYHADGSLVATNIVFFPVYPLLVRIAGSLMGLELMYAGILVSLLAGLAAAWGIFAIGNALSGRAVGAALAALWAVQTHAVIQSMVYSESLFTAFAAWCLYAVMRRQWLMAGTLAALAGATRSVGVVLVAIVLAAATTAIRRREGWRPWASLAIAPLGLVAYLAWVAYALGRLDGWFYMQAKGWGSTFDGGRQTLHIFIETLLLRKSGLEIYEVSAVLLASICLFVLLVRLRVHWSLLVYGGGLLVLTLGAAGFYHSKSRFLLPDFPLLLPLAAALVKVPRRVAAIAIAVAAVASAFYGGYLLFLWPVSF
jgi:Mannosyltransferase (PIG-V)